MSPPVDEATPKRASMRHSVAQMSALDRVVYRAIRALLEAFCRVFWRFEVVGRERLPVTGPFILAPVHRSNIDFLVVGASIPRVLRFMAKDSIWELDWFGRFLERMGAFPVNRDHPDRGALRCCEEALAHGSPVVMFPEGRRMAGDTVEDILEGPAWVACRHRVPIVPMGLGHTDEAMPIGAKMIRPVKLRVVIGEPIYPDAPLTGRVPKHVVSEFSERLRDEVQRCYDEARSR